MSISPSQLAYLPQNDEQALRDWLGEHFQWHKRLQERAVQDGHTNLGTYNVADMADRDDWLYFHSQEHEAIAETYNLQTPPDLTFLDFDDPVNWNNWMQSHALIHENERKVIGL